MSIKHLISDCSELEMYAYLDFTKVPIKHILINLTTLTVIPTSLTILSQTFLDPTKHAVLSHCIPTFYEVLEKCRTLD
jgi:hypothetical protein